MNVSETLNYSAGQYMPQKRLNETDRKCQELRKMLKTFFTLVIVPLSVGKLLGTASTKAENTYTPWTRISNSRNAAQKYAYIYIAKLMTVTKHWAGTLGHICEMVY